MAQALAFGLIGTPAAAATYVYTNVGDTNTINLVGGPNGTVMPGLTAQLTWTLSTKGSFNDWYFNYTLTNNSSAPVTAARFTSLGSDIAENFNVAFVSGSVFTGLSSGPISNGTNVDWCTKVGPNCAGGGGGGLTIGQSTSGLLRFITDPGTTQLTFSNIGVRVQSINASQLGVRGGSALLTEATGGGGAAIPEPSTWALMIMGFGGAGAMLRRRRKQQVFA